MSKTLKVFLAGLVFTTAAAQAQEQNPEEAARAIAEAEERFYQMGQEQGTRAAFLEFMAEDGVVFQPMPVNARKVWSEGPATGLSLKWQPIFAAMSGSADLGYTTGPSEYRREKADETPFGYGHFISIWKKQSDGTWKVALDVGIENPKPSHPPDELQLSPGKAPAADKDIAAARAKLASTRRSYASNAGKDSTAALAAAASEHVRVYREGVFPAVGKEAAALMLSVRRGKLALNSMGEEISAAADLAYSYGKYTFSRGETQERGHYLQIWRADENGNWSVAVDYQLPMPPTQKKR